VGLPAQEGVKTEVDLDDSVEITCVGSVSDEPVLVVSSPHKPHPSPAPTSTNHTPTVPPYSSTNHTPVLFTDSSATPKPVPPSKETVAIDEDDDETPPLLPHPHIQEGNKRGVVKAATPLRRTKANMRMTLSHSCKTLVIGGCGQNGSSIAKQVGGAIICSSCGISLTSSEVLGERVRLDEVEGMRGSRLWGEVGPGETYLLPAAAILSSTTQRQDGVCNAVWDETVGMCFGVLECPSGHRVGVRVHTAPNSLSSLVDKVLLPTERTGVDCQN
jgi:hypothetical protein